MDASSDSQGQARRTGMKPWKLVLIVLAIVAFPFVCGYLIFPADYVRDLFSRLKFSFEHPVNVARLTDDGSLELYTSGNVPDGVFLVSSDGERIDYRDDWDAEVRATPEKLSIDDQEYKLIRGYSFYLKSTFDSSNKLDATIESIGGSELGMYNLVRIKLDIEWLRELLAKEEVAFVLEVSGESTDAVIVIPENRIKIDKQLL